MAQEDGNAAKIAGVLDRLERVGARIIIPSEGYLDDLLYDAFVTIEYLTGKRDALVLSDDVVAEASRDDFVDGED